MEKSSLTALARHQLDQAGAASSGRSDPHPAVEGAIVACYATRARNAHIYIRGEAVHAIRRMTAAVAEAYTDGSLVVNILGSGFTATSSYAPVPGPTSAAWTGLSARRRGAPA